MSDLALHVVEDRVVVFSVWVVTERCGDPSHRDVGKVEGKMGRSRIFPRHPDEIVFGRVKIVNELRMYRIGGIGGSLDV